MKPLKEFIFDAYEISIILDGLRISQTMTAQSKILSEAVIDIDSVDMYTQLFADIEALKIKIENG